MNVEKALSAIPKGLRDPLLREYRDIVQNYMERRWAPSELSGGRFCEVVYTIIDGMASGSYAAGPAKPSNFVGACRNLENHTNLTRSLRILVPRMLPALYEVRNNRNVGHVGGDVDPNHMDSTVVLSIVNWIMAELVRVVHDVSIEDAKALVEALADRQIPLVWERGGVKRVLDPEYSLQDQLLILLASVVDDVQVEELMNWLDYTNKQYFGRLLNKLHKERLIEFDKNKKLVVILPPGSNYVAELLAEP